MRRGQMNKLLLPLVLIAQPALAEESMTECRQIEDIVERVSCYDDIVDSRYPADSRAGVETNKPPASPESAAIPDALSLFGTHDSEAKRIVENSLAIEQISQIEATVVNVRESASMKLTVVLDNGQIWRQLDNQPMRLKSGETVIVRKASLGSFLMEKKSGGRSIRVKRTN